MTRPTPAELKDSIEFIAQTISSYTNGLDLVARKPFAEHAGVHMQRLIQATQKEPEQKEKK